MSGIRLDQAVIEFKRVFEEYDLFINEVKADGSIHRCRAVGDANTEKSGAYFIKPDYPYNYYVINFRQSISYKGNFNNLKDRNFKRLSTHVNKNSEITYSNDDLKQAKRSNYASKLFYNGLVDFEKILNNDYLTKKQVLPIGIRYDMNSTLLIPGRDINDKIWTLQFILPDGTKRFLSKSKKLGCFHKVGWSTLDADYCSEIYITEGYATSVTIFSATAKPAVAAFDAGNMISVGSALRNKYPMAQLVFCLDVDYPGISYGLKAAIKNQGKVVLPFLSKNDLDNKMNDFNDLQCINGLEEVNNQIFLQIPNMKLILVQAYKLLNNEISIDDIDPKFHNLAEKYIYGYYISDVANKINELTSDNAQFNALSVLNELYKEDVRKAVIKLAATQCFYNKRDYQENFLYEEIQEYILSFMIEKLAIKISEETHLDIRRSYLNKINPKFQGEVKLRLNYHWQLRSKNKIKE